MQCTYTVHILCNALDNLYAGWQSGAWSWWRHLLPWIGATWWETLPHTVAHWHSHLAHSIITQHGALPTHRDRPNAEPSVKDADQLAKSLFIRRRIPAKNYAAYICSDFETTLPFTTPEYVTVVLCSSNHGLPLSKYTKTSHHQFYFSLVAYYKNIWIKMAIYCPEGSGTLRQQLLMMH